MTHANFCQQFIPARGKVLDVGAGKGNFCVDMALADFATFGIEINPAYVQQTQARVAEAGVSVDVLLGQAEQLPYQDNFFDFANCAEVTEHTENPTRICEEIYRVLKPGGRAYVSFHNRFGWYDFHYHLYGINWLPRIWTEPILRCLRKQKNDGEAGRQKLTTMHYYTYGQAQKLLRGVGFFVTDTREEKIKSRNWLSFWLLIYRLIARPLYFNSFHFLVEKPMSLKQK